jgi:hypothetical protein
MGWPAIALMGVVRSAALVELSVIDQMISIRATICKVPLA